MRAARVLGGSIAFATMVGLLLVTGCQPQASPAPTPTIQKTFPTPAPVGATPIERSGGERNAASGREVFTRLCNACHPAGREGLGPSLVGITDRLSEEGVMSRVRSGGGMMPPFSRQQISDSQLGDLVAHLQTLGRAVVASTPTPTPQASPAPPPPPTATPTATPTAVARSSPTPSPAATPTAAPRGDVQAGGRTFASLCNACHPGGQRGMGPPLVGVVGRMSEEEVVSRMRAGKGLMPAFSAERISEQQLVDLLAYLRSLK